MLGEKSKYENKLKQNTDYINNNIILRNMTNLGVKSQGRIKMLDNNII